ncbi:unnamed protein product [Prorocentrum cordatum]|uniref:PROP1-like PPR domain-containing protein n=1 Tax=Prorocentrum cordatum TaxID=2364126 RepID=A0ABN9XIE9_9DINO|nr:unnamed protein product [Polarella glacialis]
MEAVSAPEMQALHLAAERQHGYCPAAAAAHGAEFVAEADGVRLVPAFGPELERLAAAEEAELGVPFAERRGEGALQLTDEALLLAGDRALKRAPGMRAEEWVSVAARVEGTVGALNAHMHEATTRGGVAEAVQLLDDMRSRAAQPDVVTYTTLVKGHVRKGTAASARSAEALMEQALAEGVRVDVMACSALLEVFAKAGDCDGVRRWVGKMSQLRVPPDGRCYALAVQAYAQAGQLDEAEQWLERADRERVSGLKPHIALLGVHSQSGDAEAAERIFRRMLSRGLSPDTQCYNLVLDACSRGGRPDRAEHWLSELEAGPGPDVCSFNFAMNAHGHAGDGAAARRLLGRLLERGLQPTAHTYAALAVAPERAGGWQEVEGLLREMRAASLGTDARMASMLLSAHANAGPGRSGAAAEAFRGLPAEHRRDRRVHAALRRALGREEAARVIDAGLRQGAS